MNEFQENIQGTDERTLAERQIEGVRKQGVFSSRLFG